MTKWTDNEFDSLDLKDSRLNKRFEQIISAFDRNPGKPISQCFQTNKEITACYRFLSNPYISEQDLFIPHRKATISRIKQQDVALCINDTTSLDYTMKTSIEDLGILEASSRRGIFFHPLIAVSPNRIPLGTVHINNWKRDEIEQRENLSGWKRIEEPIEDKESFRWLQGYREANKVAKECPDTQIIYMADREADIMELFVEATQENDNLPKAQLIIRSRHDRLMDDPEEGKKLREKLQKSPKLGELTYNLKRKGQATREVTLSIRTSRVSFKVKRLSSDSLPTVTIYAVMAKEENPPKDEEPIVWLLLTTIPVNSLEDALKIIHYYTCRWEIEMFFCVLKSGLNIEKRGLQKAKKLELLIVLFAVLAYRVMSTCKISREFPEYECTLLFTEIEWKVAWAWVNRGKSFPETRPSIGEIYKIIARMGGYIGSKTSPPPGYTVTWRGLMRLQEQVEGWKSCEALKK